jgi:hypothetical protein
VSSNCEAINYQPHHLIQVSLGCCWLGVCALLSALSTSAISFTRNQQNHVFSIQYNKMIGLPLED